MDHSLRIASDRPAKILAGLATLMLLLHMGSWLLYQAGVVQVKVLRLLFDMRDEGNVFQFFAAMLFVIAAVMMFLNRTMANSNGRERTFWTVLGVLFLFLASDEAGQVHEKFNKPVRRWLGDGDLGALNYPWLLPYAVALLILLVVLWRGFMKLDRSTRQRMVLAAVIFLAGAMGMELVEASFANEGVEHATADVVIYTIEECLEMTALIVLIDTLVRRMARSGSSVRLSFVPEADRADPVILGPQPKPGHAEHGKFPSATPAHRTAADV